MQPYFNPRVIKANKEVMKSLVIFILGLISIQSIAQQSETRQLSSFKGIKVSNAVDVYLKKGSKESARVEVSGVQLTDVITDMEGTSLRVKMRSNMNWNKINVKVYVTYVSLEKISASSASSVFAEEAIKANDLTINVSSAANVELAVDAAFTTVDASSAGEVVLEGKSTKLEVEASSAADVDAYKLDCETVNASASSGGEAKISVSKDLDAHASSGADIRYRGNPSRTNTSSSSGGSVKKTN